MNNYYLRGRLELEGCKVCGMSFGGLRSGRARGRYVDSEFLVGIEFFYYFYGGGGKDM